MKLACASRSNFRSRGGIDGLVPVGTTGESPTLDFKEHVRVIELTVKFAAGRVPVIAGTGANATSEAHRAASDRQKSRRRPPACRVNPYYNKPTQEGLYRHFMTLADRVDLPIVLYNIPGRTSVTMSAQTVARLGQASTIIVAIKEATGSLDMASEILSLCDITVLSGDDSLTLPLMSIGAKGVISVASNLIPAQIKAAHASSPWPATSPRPRAMHHRAFPLHQDPVPRRQPRRHQARHEIRRPGQRRTAPAALGSQRRHQIGHRRTDAQAGYPDSQLGFSRPCTTAELSC